MTMHGIFRLRALVTALALGASLSGCVTVVNGRGTSGSGGEDFYVIEVGTRGEVTVTEDKISLPAFGKALAELGLG